MSNTPYIIVIPARYSSMRLPGKVLEDIGGQSMLERVWRAAKTASAERVVVATDDHRIAGAVEAFGGEHVMTAPTHASGSDRIAECADLLGLEDDQLVVNLQGDEPDMPPDCLDQVASLLSDSQGADVATLFWPVEEPAELKDPSVVKVVAGRPRAGAGSAALYFSRAPVPHSRHHAGAAESLAAGIPYRRHLGLYAFRVSALRRFTEAGPSPLEETEGLEQLRFLELGMRIVVAQAAAPIPPGIDTPEDLARARQRAKGLQND